MSLGRAPERHPHDQYGGEPGVLVDVEGFNDAVLRARDRPTMRLASGHDEPAELRNALPRPHPHDRVLARYLPSSRHGFDGTRAAACALWRDAPITSGR